MSWRDEGFVDGRWGTRGSGILFVTWEQQFLLLERSIDVTEPGTWSIPGGAIPRNTMTGVYMDPLASALKETDEEVGQIPDLDIITEWAVTDAGGYLYTTYLARVPDRFRPRLNWESSDWHWFDLVDVDRVPLHPAMAETWHQRVVPWALRGLG